MDHVDLIEVAREEFERRSPFWAYYLAYGLEQVTWGLSLELGLHCVKRLLPTSGSTQFEQLVADVENLASWLHQKPTGVAYRPELAREIWFRPGLACDVIPQRAVSQLYAAYEFYRKHNRGHLHAVGASIAIFLHDGSLWKEKRGELFDLTIEVYQQLMSEYGSPSHG